MFFRHVVMKLKVLLLSFLLVMLGSVSLKAQQDQTVRYLNKAVELIDQLDYETAAVMCTYAIKSDSSFSDSFYLRGLCFNKIGNQSAALRDLDYAIRLNPKISEAFLLRSKVHQSLGNLKLSVSDLNKAKNLDPVGTTVYLARKFFSSILP